MAATGSARPAISTGIGERGLGPEIVGGNPAVPARLQDYTRAVPDSEAFAETPQPQLGGRRRSVPLCQAQTRRGKER